MKNFAVCILDKDIHYAKAFMKVVAMEHEGFTVGTRSACGEGCRDECDVCIGFGAADGARGSCEKAYEPSCGKYAGAAAILSEARRFVLDRTASYGNAAAEHMRNASREGAAAFEPDTLLCVHAFAGGLGTSCAAIGVGRELARYRGEQVLYLSLEDAEDAGLYPAGLRAMRAEEALYRYLRLLNTGAGKEGFDRLFGAAFVRDEYGLFRLAPDEGTGSLAGQAPGELYLFISHAAGALGLTRAVLDFGTRLNFLKMFAAQLRREEALFIEIRAEGKAGLRPRPALFKEESLLKAAFPVCYEDVRRREGYTDVGIANAFGLAVKELCDRIMGDVS